jgi:uncharacterized membrane protein YczE
MLLISFGVILMIRSNVGVSTWDTLHWALHLFLDIEVGTATIIVALAFTISVVLLRKNLQYFYMGIPVVIVGLLINVIDLVLLADFQPQNMLVRIMSFGLGLAILPLGGSFLIISTFPAGVFDEFNLVMVHLLRTNNFVLVRVIMELSAVTLAFIIGRLAGSEFGMINVGTIISALTIGLILKQYLKLFERIGLYEIKQND